MTLCRCDPCQEHQSLFPGDVKGACPPVKRSVVVRVHAGEPFQNIHCPYGAIAARPTFYRKTPEHNRVRVPFFLELPDSSKAERPAHIRHTAERYRLGLPFFLIPSVAQ